jgi:hypothetical protein
MPTYFVRNQTRTGSCGPQAVADDADHVLIYLCSRFVIKRFLIDLETNYHKSAANDQNYTHEHTASAKLEEVRGQLVQNCQ